MTQYLIDTNVLLRLILRDDFDREEQVRDIFEKCEDGKVSICCHSTCLFEVYFVLSGAKLKMPKNAVIEIIKTLLKLKVIQFEEFDVWTKALEIFEKHNISIQDSFLISKSKSEKAKFFTFDKQAEKVWKKIK